MVNSFKTSSALVVVAVILSKTMVGWCQICGKTPYGGSPAVQLYVTQLDHTTHPQNPMRFYHDVLVQTDSNITLTCTATEPEHGFPAWYYGTYLQPYMINWFVNTSFLPVSNCDELSDKVKACSLLLSNVRPRDSGKYFCQAANQVGCTFQELDLKVANGGRRRANHGGILTARHENVMKKMKLED